MTTTLLVETPISNLRNALQAMVLADSLSPPCLSVVEVSPATWRDICDRVAAAIAQLEAKADADRTILAGLREIAAGVEKNREELTEDVELRGLDL